MLKPPRRRTSLAHWSMTLVLFMKGSGPTMTTPPRRRCRSLLPFRKGPGPKTLARIGLAPRGRQSMRQSMRRKVRDRSTAHGSGRFAPRLFRPLTILVAQPTKQPKVLRCLVRSRRCLPWQSSSIRARPSTAFGARRRRRGMVPRPGPDAKRKRRVISGIKAARTSEDVGRDGQGAPLCRLVAQARHVWLNSHAAASKRLARHPVQ